MTPNSTSTRQLRILPKLRQIQEQHGYLKREDLEEFSKDSGIPLYRLQEVASFFPHFRLTPARAVTVGVCQSLACHLAGAANTLEGLRSLECKDVGVEGVSCLGRCDRAPAVRIAVNDDRTPGEVKEYEGYYLGRDIDEFKEIVRESVATKALPAGADRDSVRDGRYPSADWMIDPYKGRISDYAAVRKVVAARNEYLEREARALDDAVERTKEQLGLSADTNLEKVRNDLRAAKRNGEDAAPFPKWIKNLPDWVKNVFTQLEDANLRGMGGAGWPAARKWRDVRRGVAETRRRGSDQRAFVVVNGDESEPGTFKDRELLLHFPHLVLEAVILAGLVTEATEGFIFIRHEYSEQIAACEAEIRRAEAMGLCGTTASVLGRAFPVSVFVSPGGYVCGEQSALLEAMSDRRGEPRNLPPRPETNGLDDRPTLLSNVETFAWAPYILLNGGETYARLGSKPWKGRRFFSVCGDVERPGVYEAPIGLTLRELIFSKEYCNGIARSGKLKAIAPSGPSGGFLPIRLKAGAGLPRSHTDKKEWRELADRRGFNPLAQELDILDLELELDLFRALSPTGALGAGIIVYAEGRDMAEQAVNALEFFRSESCGKCVPCRVGSQKLTNLGNNLLGRRIAAAEWRDGLSAIVDGLGEAMMRTSICGLGPSVPIPLRTLVELFRDDLANHLT
jgi:NADH:ubiquinone oxidoreductase subunit F (NADH-binding)/NADH:ubiquinone oxidoreductase subunit E